MKVLRLGAPVTALSLSPALDMLATTHVNRRGIYLWSNTTIYGSGADIRPSELPVDARLPALASGASSSHRVEAHISGCILVFPCTWE